MVTVVIVIHLMVVLAMIGLVLLQRSDGGALGIGGGGGNFMSGPRRRQRADPLDGHPRLRLLRHLDRR